MGGGKRETEGRMKERADGWVSEWVKLSMCNGANNNRRRFSRNMSRSAAEDGLFYIHYVQWKIKCSCRFIILSRPFHLISFRFTFCPPPLLSHLFRLSEFLIYYSFTLFPLHPIFFHTETHIPTYLTGMYFVLLKFKHFVNILACVAIRFTHTYWLESLRKRQAQN